MARYRRRSPTGVRSRRVLREKGLLGIVLGAALLVMSFVMSGNGPLGSVSKGLHFPAMLAIGIGAVLVAVDAMIHRAANLLPTPKLEPEFDAMKGRAPVSSGSDGVASGNSAGNHRAKTDGQRPQQWSAAVFDAIEWRRFEAVCEALFAQAGFETRTQSHGADGGVDVWLHSRNASGPVSVVQCKHWRGKQVGVKEMREFFGVMASHGVKRGTYATSSTFTAEATAFAKGNGIHLLDGAGLLGLIRQRSPEQQQALLAVAFEGDYARPTCASCGVKMAERQPKSGGLPFWGCKNYPRCRSTLPMRA